MIQVEDIVNFEGLKLAEYAEQELRDGQEFVRYVLAASDMKVLITGAHPICVLGVVRATFLGAAHFWFLLCPDVKRGDLRSLKHAWPNIFQKYPRVQTGIEVGYEAGERFARFFGFAPFGEPYSEFGRQYQSYEARR